MSTKKEKCCWKCWLSKRNHKTGAVDVFCENSSCDCHHQSESIEWEKDEFIKLLVKYNEKKVLVPPEGWAHKGPEIIAMLDFISQAITTAVAKDRELGNPYNSVSTWKEIGKNRGYWGFFKDQVISAREKELVEEVEKKSFRGFAPYEQDYLIKKEDVLSILKH